jgi:hypothetical protein
MGAVADAATAFAAAGFAGAGAGGGKMTYQPMRTAAERAKARTRRLVSK